MAVVVYIESQDGVIKKAGLEVASYGRSIADDQGLKLIGVGFNIKPGALTLPSHSVVVVPSMYNLLCLAPVTGSKIKSPNKLALSNTIILSKLV